MGVGRGRELKGGEITAANADTDSSANGHLIKNNIRLALEAASLQWMEGEMELSMRTPRPLTAFAACMELPELLVARDI